MRRISVRALIVVGTAWLAVPVVALADDCSAWTAGEMPSCLLLASVLPPLLIAAAILMAADWLRSPGELSPEERQQIQEKLWAEDHLKPFDPNAASADAQAAKRTKEGLDGLIGR
jgi:hypothetical protein